MKIVVMSDTHGHHKALAPPKGNMFIHCGDHSVYKGSERETRAFLKWVGSLPHPHKVIIPGNHDLWCPTVNMREVAEPYGVVCLVNELAEVAGLRIYGSPNTPEYRDWAYMYPRDEPHYKGLPENLDILITHGPPYGHGDYLPHKKMRVGAIDLLNEVARVRPRFHLFGHVHEGRETEHRTKSDAIPGTLFINAACWDHRNDATYSAATFEA